MYSSIKMIETLRLIPSTIFNEDNFVFIIKYNVSMKIHYNHYIIGQLGHTEIVSYFVIPVLKKYRGSLSQKFRFSSIEII
jgi:hypothetical protein